MNVETKTGTVDPALILAWLEARSISRNLPPPVPDRGGYRVDTESAKETRRWVFPAMVSGLRDLAHDIDAPLHAIKLCATGAALRRIIPARWEIQPESYVMAAGPSGGRHWRVPDGYRLERNQNGPVSQVRILAADGTEAASGFASETATIFIYDRIGTDPAHQRRGLGRAVMLALGEARRSQATPQLLVATQDGRALYSTLGWSVYAPYATALIPAIPNPTSKTHQATP